MQNNKLNSTLHDTDYSTIKATEMPGLLIIERPIYPDNRGLFHELFRKNELEDTIGQTFEIVQSNHARSLPHVIRALHAENWNKLVYPINGEMTSVLADIRPESPTFGKYLELQFSDEHKYAVFIPKGVANSICVTGQMPVDYIYLIDAYYDGKDTRAVAWDDADLAIEWPIVDPILSDRDSNNPTLRQMFPEKFV